MLGGRGAGMELRRDVPRDEEREPEVVPAVLDPRAPPAHLGAVGARSRPRLDRQPQPGGRRVDVIVGQAHGEPAITIPGQLDERPPHVVFDATSPSTTLNSST